MGLSSNRRIEFAWMKLIFLCSGRVFVEATKGFRTFRLGPNKRVGGSAPKYALLIEIATLPLIQLQWHGDCIKRMSIGMYTPRKEHMLRGLYSVAGAMEVATRNQEIVAQNLAQVTTPGYRRQGLVFEVAGFPAAPEENAPAPLHPNVNTSPSSFTHFETGPLEQTSNPLDMAVVGDAFFVLQGPNGPVYTRNGTFELNGEGQLQARQQLSRCRPGGAITVPTNTTQITVDSEGAVRANGTEVGRLQLAGFARPQALERVGTTLFAGQAPQTPAPGTVRVEQGYREGSNVQPVQEMVSMMVGMQLLRVGRDVRYGSATSDAVS